MNSPRAFGFLAIVALAVPSALHAQAQATISTAPVRISEMIGTVIMREDPVEAAYAEFMRSGHAAVIPAERPGGSVLYPFGYERPTVLCPRLNACMIALEPGERLTDEPLAGDTERWIIDTSVMGSGEESLLVIVKPEDCGLSTNLLVPTDRRVYEMALVSDRCNTRGEPEIFTRQVRFWYPDEMRTAREEEWAEVASVAELNRGYWVDRGGSWLFGGRYPWIPRDVFDDGVRTYIVLPEQARTGEMPILYALEGGERQVLNYALRGDTLIADRLLQSAALVLGSGRGERTLEIENRMLARREEGGT